MDKKLEYEITSKIKVTLPEVADIVKMLAQKQCNDVEEAKLLYLSLFVVLIRYGYESTMQEERIDILIHDITYSANLSTLKDFLKQDYASFMQKIEDRKEKEKIDENKAKEAVDVSSEVAQKEELLLNENVTLADIRFKEEINAEIVKKNQKENVSIFDKDTFKKKKDLLPVSSGTLPPQLMRENYVKHSEDEIYYKKNFIFNKHTIKCKKDEYGISFDNYEIYIFPLEYCNIGSSSKILAAIISEDDRIHYAISQSGKKSIVMDMDEYRFIFSGKWEIGKFKTTITSYSYEEKDFIIDTNEITELNSGIFMEEIGITKNIDGYKYHFFPLDLKNDETIGTCSFMTLDKQTKEIRISNKNKEIMLVTNGMVQTYHMFWTGEVINIEQI